MLRFNQICRTAQNSDNISLTQANSDMTNLTFCKPQNTDNINLRRYNIDMINQDCLHSVEIAASQQQECQQGFMKDPDQTLRESIHMGYCPRLSCPQRFIGLVKSFMFTIWE